MSDRYLLISADGHAGPPAAIYRDYLDPAFRERFDEQQKAIEELRALSPIAGGDKSEFQHEWELATDGDGGLTAAYDGTERNRVLDREGVVAEVLFPDADVLGTGRLASSPFGTGLAAGPQTDPTDAVAGSRAHNRWLSDFVADDPHRRIGIAVVPAIIPRHGHRARAGARGEGARPSRHPHPDPLVRPAAYNEPWYDPLWALAEELGLVLHTHSGRRAERLHRRPGLGPIYASRGRLVGGPAVPRPDLGRACSSGSRRCGTRWPRTGRGGCPTRSARWTRSGIGGAQHQQDGFAVPGRAVHEAAAIHLDRNCFFGASTPGVDDIERRHDVGVGNIMWGNDMPHPEGTFPYTRYWIRERFGDVPEDEARRMLGLTAAAGSTASTSPRCRRLSGRIGPTVDEVHGDDVQLAAPAEAIA